MKLQQLSQKILDTGDIELIKRYIHTFSDFHFFCPSYELDHPIIPYDIRHEDGTSVLKGKITSYSDYKNLIDQLIDLGSWNHIENLVLLYKSIHVSRILGTSDFD